MCARACEISVLTSARLTNTSMPQPEQNKAQDSEQGAAGADGLGGATAVAEILFVASVLLLLLVFAFGVASLQLCFHACYRRRALPQAPSRSVRWRRGDDGAAVGGGGTQTSVVWREAAARSEEECAVCLAGLEGGEEEARFLPRCGHGFHAECVSKWLATHSTCPLCRITVARPDVVPPAPASALPPAPPEPPNYGASGMPARVSDEGAVTVTA